MKVNAESNYILKFAELVEPIKLTLILETKEDVEKIYSIFDYTYIVQSLEIEDVAIGIRKLLDATYKNQIGVSVQNHEWFEKLRNKLR